MDNIDNNVTVSVTLNLDDYTEANRAFLKKRMAVMSIFYFLFGTFLAIYPALKAGQEVTHFLIQQAIFIGIALGALASFVEVTMLKIKSKKVFTANKNMAKEQIYSFNPEGIGIKAETGSGQIPWANISKLLESKSAFYIFTTKRKALIIPKRELKDENELNQLRDIINSRVF